MSGPCLVIDCGVITESQCHICGHDFCESHIADHVIYCYEQSYPSIISDPPSWSSPDKTRLSFFESNNNNAKEEKLEIEVENSYPFIEVTMDGEEDEDEIDEEDEEKFDYYYSGEIVLDEDLPYNQKKLKITAPLRVPNGEAMSTHNTISFGVGVVTWNMNHVSDSKIQPADFYKQFIKEIESESYKALIQKYELKEKAMRDNTKLSKEEITTLSKGFKNLFKLGKNKKERIEKGLSIKLNLTQMDSLELDDFNKYIDKSKIGHTNQHDKKSIINEIKIKSKELSDSAKSNAILKLDNKLIMLGKFITHPDNYWVDLLALNEINDIQALEAKIASNSALKMLATGPELRLKKAPTQKNPDGPLGYREYYPIISRSSANLTHIKTECYYPNEEPKEVKDKQLEIYRDLGKPNLKDRLRPIIVYTLKNKDDIIFHLGVVHTTPSGSEFIRPQQFMQVNKPLEKIHQQSIPFYSHSKPLDKDRFQLLTEKSPQSFWIVCGDFYLTPETRIISDMDLRVGKKLYEMKTQKNDRKGLTWDELELAETYLEYIDKEAKHGSGIDSLRNLAKLTFQTHLPNSLKLITPLSATNSHKLPPNHAPNSEKQIADFFICSKKLEVARAGVMRHLSMGGGALKIDIDHRHLVKWMEISDHTPVGGYFGTPSKDNDLMAKRIFQCGQAGEAEAALSAMKTSLAKRIEMAVQCIAALSEARTVSNDEYQKRLEEIGHDESELNKMVSKWRSHLMKLTKRLNKCQYSVEDFESY